MENAARQLQILAMLAENLKNPQPQLVPSLVIAQKLRISLKETQLLLQLLADQGAIECNEENQLSLIPATGLQHLQAQAA